MESLIVFTNYYFAYKAEKLLLAEGIKLQLIPTPEALHNMCGLCILCAQADLARILDVLHEAHISHSGLYTYDRAAKKCTKLHISEE